MADWDPLIYERYKAQRDRPALDLLLQVPGDLQPEEIWDLGCGTGELAALLKARHPSARVHGLDSSAAMLETAQERAADVDWRLGDIEDFRPEVAPDLIFTNAALHWVAGHERLFPALAETLAPGGVLACQMPDVGWGHWRAILRDMTAQGPWRAAAAGLAAISVDAPADYYARLAPLCAGGVDIWSTEYLHLLQGEDPVLDWTSGTALRPCLEALADEAQRDAFAAAFAARLRQAYPRRADGVTLFPFRRLFIVARR